MSPRRLLPALLLVAACGDDPDPNTIAAKVRATPELSSLAAALEDSGVMATLEDTDASLTLLAPTNDAVAQFFVTQDGAFDALDAGQLRYHVGDREIVLGTSPPTSIDGDPIVVTNNNNGLLLNDDARPTGSSIDASNGVIHVIDAVLARPTTTTYTSTPALPFATTEVTDTITVDAGGFVRGIEVTLDIDHGEIYMLAIALRNDATGQELQLVSHPGTYADDIKLTLSDSAPVDIQDDVMWGFEDEQAYTEERYAPYEPLRFGYGLPAAGTWTLIVRSYYEGFEDSWLNAWSLHLTTTEERPDPTLAVARPRDASGVIGRGFHETLDVRVKRLAGLTGPIEVTLDTSGVLDTSPVILDDGAELASIPMQTPSDALDGFVTLAFEARAGRARRVRTLDGSIVTPDVDGVELLSQFSLAELGAPGGSGNDCWGWTDPTTNREYALMGTSHGMAIVDITDPVDARYLGILPTHTEDSLWRSIKVYDDHAFVVSEAPDHGLQVFDLTRLRDVTEPQVFTEDAHYDGFGNGHNVVINEATGFAYVVGATEPVVGGDPLCGGGLLILDISTPTQPTHVGCFGGGVPTGVEPGPEWPTEQYTHDAQCVVYNGPDVAYQGREICLTSDANTGGIGVVDMTVKATPAQLSRIGYVGAGFTHQGWLTDDHRYFLLDDEFDEFDGINTRTYVFDFADLDAPFLVGTFDNPRDAVGHNMYIHEGFAYQANYTSGLRIVDIAGVATADLAEVAYYDTFPEDDAFDDGVQRARPHPEIPRVGQSAEFDGVWNNYPFFASGSVILSDMKRGLFVVRRTD